MDDGDVRPLTGDRHDAARLDAWLEQRFPGDGGLRQRATRLNRRRLLVMPLVLVALFLATAAVTTRWGEALRPRPLPVVVACVILAVAGIVAGAVYLFRVVRLAGDTAASGRGTPLLPALTWGQRRAMLEELRGRRPVPPGDEPALAALARGRRQAAPLGWLGGGLLGVAVSQVLIFPTGLLGALAITNGILAVTLIAFGLRAAADARAGERLGLPD